MKLEISHETKGIRFDQLIIGDIFVRERAGYAYIRIALFQVANGGDWANAICLNSGARVYIHDTDKVFTPTFARLSLGDVK